MYVNLPKDENRKKLAPLLNNGDFEGHNVIEVQSKLPTITILDVTEFTDKNNFIERIKKQNPDIAEKMNNGSKFEIVFAKKSRNDENNFHVVARMDGDIHNAIKGCNNKLFMDCASYRVVDRFYIKRCNKCQRFGHYEKHCQSEPSCCGYCKQDHQTKDCEVEEGDFAKYN